MLTDNMVEVLAAYREETKSINTFTGNGLKIFKEQPTIQQQADEKLLRSVLELLEEENLTQSALSLIIAALHRVGTESKGEVLSTFVTTALA